MAYTEKDHQLKVNSFEDITIQLRNLYDKKNWDYRDGFAQSFDQWGLPMLCIRLTDKLNRLVSMSTGQQMKVQDESIRDTLMDMANYAIMGLVEMNIKEGEE